MVGRKFPAKRKRPDPEEDDDEDDEDDDELDEFAEDPELVERRKDLEARARSSLEPGEVILGEGKPPEEVKARGICNAPVLEQKLKDMEYKVPDGAKRVPWVDTLCIDGPSQLPSKLTAKDGVKLETAFADLAGEAVREAYRRLRVMKIPASRPHDFFAEMLRTDAQMYKVRERAAEEQRRIRIVESRKKAQSAKKFEKKSKTVKQQARAAQKQDTLDEIKDWQQQRKSDKKNTDDSTLEDILNKRKQQPKAEAKKKYKPPEKSAKQKAKDAKYGFGGKKRGLKSNTRESVDDFSSSPWAKQAKGKGKGKAGGGGGGSKGKGKGKGKGKSRRK
mmetsp:Transcript_34310/g.80239  ORF Transcript_34310/g.80239 Transcript_34310/m.80239 type:complete len:333 (-) Transcript_34310:162-1160(-)